MQLALGKAKDAARTISKIPGVKMAHAVTGPFDVSAFADVPDLAALSDLVIYRIQHVEGGGEDSDCSGCFIGHGFSSKSEGKFRKTSITEEKVRNHVILSIQLGIKGPIFFLQPRS